MTRKGLGLCMIVKNEENVIERCLNSVKPYIDEWIITDTGSTDNTIKVINKCMEGVKGKVIEREWVNFGHNRTEALQLLTQHTNCKWGLFMDADDNIDVKNKSFFKHLSSDSIIFDKVDGFKVSIKSGNLNFMRCHLHNLNAEWKWIGPVHEYSSCIKPIGKDANIKNIESNSITIIARSAGARSKDTSRFLKDISLLKYYLLTHKDDPRYTFYLGESYLHAGFPELAKIYYLKVLDLNGWVQEKYVAIQKIIEISYDENIDKLLKLAWKSLEFDKTRLEVPFVLFSNIRKRNIPFTLEMYSFGKMCLLNNLNRKMDESYLFSHSHVYDYAFDDEFSIVCYWTGNYKDSLECASRALEKCPTNMVSRIEQNILFSKNKI